jgi:hypothetical protein
VARSYGALFGVNITLEQLVARDILHMGLQIREQPTLAADQVVLVDNVLYVHDVLRYRVRLEMSAWIQDRFDIACIKLGLPLTKRGV